MSENRSKPGLTTYQQQAYEFIKDQITTLELKPGQFITDSQVAETLNISRTPVREALRRLQQEHLLTQQAGRGWQVSTLSVRDIQDIFEIKRLLEGLNARQAAACPDEGKRAALRETMDKMERATLDDSFELWRQADSKFHQLVYSMSPNQRLGQITDGLNAQWYRMRVGLVALEGRVERSNQEHEQIVAAILSRDGDAAELAMRAHLDNVQQELVRVLRVVLPFMVDGV